MKGKEALAVLTATSVLGGAIGAASQFERQATARDRAAAAQTCIDSYHDSAGGNTKQTNACLEYGWVGGIKPPVDYDAGTPGQLIDGYVKLQRSRAEHFDPASTIWTALGGASLGLFAIYKLLQFEEDNNEDEDDEPEETIKPQNEVLTSFSLNSEDKEVIYSFTMDVADGVECDVYKFADDETKDLGIVKVAPGAKTPRQRIVLGDGARTLEGYVSGTGTLKVTSVDGQERAYSFAEKSDKNLPRPVEVKQGEIMRWEAGAESELVFYEVCEPPYQDGRFENLD